ncbi:MAG TPA: hypothetical protein VL200_00040 [Lacunisphaera sp.]|jgi:Tfp pilus assembly protein PilN|nr:hypothetical protein [Lacunisphaera sp.]
MNATLTSSGVRLLPSHWFFVQPLAIEAGVPVATQADVAIESVSPFPLGQLFHGVVTSGDGTRALGFAAYQARVPLAERNAWQEATAVVPTFLGLLGPRPLTPRLVVHRGPAELVGVAWDGRSPLPAAVFAHALPDGDPDVEVEATVGEWRRMAGVGDGEDAVQRLTGPIEVAAGEDGETVFSVNGDETIRLPAEAMAAADVREKGFLDQRRADERRQRTWWRVFQVAVAMLGLAAVVDVAAAAVGLWNRALRRQMAGRAEEVQRVETAQTLAVRVEDLAARRRRPLEWLALAADARPPSVQFVRVSSREGETLEIEARTADAADVANFETALHRVAGVEAVRISDLRSRQGTVSFIVTIKFRAGAGKEQT